MKNEENVLFFKSGVRFFFQSIVPFTIPFFLEIPDRFIVPWMKWIIVISSAIIDFCIIFLLNIKEKKYKEKNFENQAARDAYSCAYTLNEKKRNYLIEQSYGSEKKYPEYILPYNIHEYIGEICKSFESIVSQITGINEEYMSVSFIYRYCYDGADADDTSWRWTIGRELTMIKPRL